MSSPFASRLGTNYAPTDAEVTEIQSLLVEPTLRIKSLDDEIADLQKSIDRLVKERVDLESYVQAHNALISPVRRLPLDVIEEIFVACLPTHRNCVMSATEAPILLGRICSAWRAIALSAPRLWASLHIVEPPSPSPWHIGSEADFNREIAQRLEITKMWLSRSGQCPLSISLRGIVQEGAPTSTVQLIQVLIPLAPRWQHIHFATAPMFVFDILSNIDVDMPWLESVTFLCGGSFPDLQNITYGSFGMLQGPRLSSLSVPRRLFALERFSLPWEQLTTLAVGGPESLECTTEMVLLVVSKCIKLQSCKLLLCDGREISVSEHPIIELCFLHTLVIRCSSLITHATSNLLRRLWLPELRNFVFLGSYDQEAHFPALADFFTRSTRVESFEVTDNTLSSPSLDELLQSLPPTICRLKIRSIPSSGWAIPPRRVDDATLQVLATLGVCPALRHLTIEQGTDISDAALLQFITARMLEFDPSLLECVEVKFGRGSTIDIMPDLQPFLHAGLTVSLDYSPVLLIRSSPWTGLDEYPDPWPGRIRDYW
ncbi:hypothetical protein MSAN_00584000 [Mycena sanguinolenta]|uniref:F-box domain-containing protein n=1 Tax=Mycena sanguinolenta TaxID=230812 RepID=A0A8H6ZDL9_9AGAR|nr:hypothetical protein MSAN_00584000 [Mycena sanguinolenta]